MRVRVRVCIGGPKRYGTHMSFPAGTGTPPARGWIAHKLGRTRNHAIPVSCQPAHSRASLSHLALFRCYLCTCLSQFSFSSSSSPRPDGGPRCCGVPHRHVHSYFAFLPLTHPTSLSTSLEADARARAHAGHLVSEAQVIVWIYV